MTVALDLLVRLPTLALNSLWAVVHKKELQQSHILSKLLQHQLLSTQAASALLWNKAVIQYRKDLSHLSDDSQFSITFFLSFFVCT